MVLFLSVCLRHYRNNSKVASNFCFLLLYRRRFSANITHAHTCTLTELPRLADFVALAVTTFQMRTPRSRCVSLGEEKKSFKKKKRSNLFVDVTVSPASPQKRICLVFLSCAVNSVCLLSLCFVFLGPWIPEPFLGTGTLCSE